MAPFVDDMALSSQANGKPSRRSQAFDGDSLTSAHSSPLDANSRRMTPSVYALEMSKTTADYYRGGKVPDGDPSEETQIVDSYFLGNTTHHKHSSVHPERPIFEASPTRVTFQAWEPFQTYEVKISFRNRDNYIRKFKVLPLDSEVFSITKVSSNDVETSTSLLPSGSAVAPGMDVQYAVRFTPRQQHDYHAELHCVTERERFVVPVRAISGRAILNFPDVVDFGDVPVKHESVRPIMVQNLGTKSSRFILRTMPPFSITPHEGHLNTGELVQVQVGYVPTTCDGDVGELEIELNDGECVYTRLSGRGMNERVRLLSDELSFPSTFIGTQHQLTAKFVNKSSVTVRFSWCKLATADDEQQERLVESLRNAEEDGFRLRDGGCGDSDVPGSRAASYKQRRSRLSVPSTVLTSSTGPAGPPSLPFRNETFAISPEAGECWPGSEIEFVITAAPKHAGFHETVAYLNVTGREQRLPLCLACEGAGPVLRVAQEVIDIGQIFVHTPQSVSITLDNLSPIDAVYHLERPSSLFASKFSFDLDSGMLRPNERAVVPVNFQSDILGSFEETFCFGTSVSDEKIPVCFRGVVVGPTFTVSVEAPSVAAEGDESVSEADASVSAAGVLDHDHTKMDFGRVAYGFLYTRYLTISNTSTIPLRYALRIPDDGGHVDRQFQILPQRGTVLPGGTDRVRVDFMPSGCHDYEWSLVVDLDDVGKNVHCVPIIATTDVAEVALSSDTVDFGDCFLGHTYTRELTLSNAGDLPAKFEVIFPPQEEAFQYAHASTNFRKGTVAPNGGTSTLVVSLVASTMGSVMVPMYLRVAGSDHPMVATLTGRGMGPVVTIDAEEVNFGKCQVLVDIVRSITVTNSSDIPANVVIELESPVFRTPSDSITIAPRSSTVVSVTANLDDTVSFRSLLSLYVDNGPELKVLLVARGDGSTVVPAEKLPQKAGKALIRFGTQFVGRKFQKTLRLENRGRKPQSVHWVNYTHKANMSTYNAALKRIKVAAAGTTGKEVLPEEPVQVFSVDPAKIVIEPQTGVEFDLCGITSFASSPSEELHCIVMDKGRSIPVLKTLLTANCVAPLLSCEPSTLSFVYQYGHEANTVFSQEVVLQNTSPLPVTFCVKVGAPFSVDHTDYSLDPDSSCKLTIYFDPHYRHDRLSHCAKGRLTASLIPARGSSGVPSADSTVHMAELVAQIDFPNLRISEVVSGDTASDEVSSIDFGAVVVNTNQTRGLRVENVGNVPTQCRWKFGSDHSHVDPIFDVAPTEFVLNPGECLENVLFTFYSKILDQRIGFDHSSITPSGFSPDNSVVPTSIHEDSVVCHVEGGPLYDLSLRGVSSLVQFSIDKSELDFGAIPYFRSEKADLVIQNLSSVGFSFHVAVEEADVSRLSSKSVVSVEPSSGFVQGRDRMKIAVHFCSGVPDVVSRRLLVQVAQLQPVPVLVRGQGVYTSVKVGNLPRGDKEDDLLQEICRERGLPLESAQNAQCAPRSSPFVDVKRPASAQSSSAVTHSNQLTIFEELDRRRLCEHILLVSELSPTFYAGRYLCNLGSVIKGQVRRKRVKVTNNSGALWAGLYPSAAVISMDKNKLLASGLSVEVVNGSGTAATQKLTDGQSVEFNFMLQTKSKNLSPGEFRIPVPICVRGGPSVLVECFGTIVVPDLDISAERVDFSPTICGKCEVQTLRLSNRLTVPVEWSIPEKLNSATGPTSHARDFSAFSFVPRSGIVQPGEHAFLQVRFSPKEVRSYTTKVPLKISSSSKTKSLLLKGDGDILNLEVLQLPAMTPSMDFAFPATYPYNPTSVEVRLFNKGKKTVEIVAIDTDETLARCSAALNDSPDLFDDNGRLYVKEGISLEALLKPHQTVPNVEAPIEEVVISADQEVVTSLPQVSSEQLLKPFENVRDGASPMSNGSIGSSRDAFHVLLIDGPPDSSSADCADYLSKNLEWPIVDIGARVLEEGSDMKYGSDELGHFKELFSVQKKSADASGCSGVVVVLPVDVPGASSTSGASNRLNLIQTLVRSLTSCSARVTVSFISFEDSDSECRLRMRKRIDSALESELQGIESSCDVKEVDEEAFEEMEQDEQEAYLAKMNSYRKRVKEIEQKRRAILEKRKRVDEVLAELDNISSGTNAPLDVSQNAILKRSTSKKIKPTQGGRRGSAPDENAILKERARVLHSTLLEDPFEASLQQYRVEVDSISGWVDSVVATVSSIEAEDTRSEASHAQGLKRVNSKRSARQAVSGDAHGKLAPQASIEGMDEGALRCISAFSKVSARDVSSVLGQLPDVVVHCARNDSSLKAAAVKAEQEATALANLPPPDPPIPSPFTEYCVRSANSSSAGTRSGAGGKVKRGVVSKPDSDKLEMTILTHKDLPVPSVEEKEADSAPARNVLVRKSSKQKRELLRDEHADAEGESLEEGCEVSGSALLDSRVTRWSVVPGGYTDLTLRFRPTHPGAFKRVVKLRVLEMDPAFSDISLTCSGTCMFPSIARDVRQVFYDRVKVRPSTDSAARKFIVSENVLDFGALICGRVPSEKSADDSLADSHSCRIRLSNNSNFVSKVSIHIRSCPVADTRPVTSSAQNVPRVAASKKGAPIPSSIAEPPHSVDCPFSAVPGVAEIRPEETTDVLLTCFPQGQFHWKGECTIMIENNPDVMCFGVEARGTVPRVDVPLKDQAIDFGRVLLQRPATRKIMIKNVSLVPVKWSLTEDVLSAAFTKHFKVNASEGILSPGEEGSCDVTFLSNETGSSSHEFSVEVFNADDETSTLYQRIPIKVNAEAYEVQLDVKFPGSTLENGIDFGTIKVSEGGTRAIQLLNQGRYDVWYDVGVIDPGYDSAFVIEPASGLLRAGGKQPVSVNVSFASSTTLAINSSSVLKCVISEPLPSDRSARETGQVASSASLQVAAPCTRDLLATFPIGMAIQAVFSRYHIRPQTSLNFGPISSEGGQKKCRTFEIVNDGELSFSIDVIKESEVDGYLSQSVAESPAKPQRLAGAKASTRADSRSKVRGGGAGGGSDDLIAASFRVWPAKRVPVEPGEMVAINVEFDTTKGGGFFHETLAVMVSDRDLHAQPSGIRYELIGESCIPGILCDASGAVFEEQAIISTQSTAVNMTEHTAAVFCKDDRVLMFPTIFVGKQHVERIRLTNAAKVSSTVSVEFIPQDADHDKIASPRGVSAFSVHPNRIVLPAQEARYVTVKFEPGTLSSSSGMFRATVENGTDPSTSTLEFECRGSGTLPSLVIDGDVDVDFGEIANGQVITKVLKVTNNGCVHAKGRMNVLKNMGVSIDPDTDGKSSHGAPFTLTGVDAELSLPPGGSHHVEVTFVPIRCGNRPISGSCVLQVVVNDNPFETSEVHLHGKSYYEPLTIECEDKLGPDCALKIAPGSGDLSFGAIAVGETRSFRLRVQNRTSEVYRVNWLQKQGSDVVDVPDNVVGIEPLSAYIDAGGSRSFTLSICGDVPLSLRDEAGDARLVLNGIPVRFVDRSGSASWTSLDTHKHWLQAKEAKIRVDADTVRVSQEHKFAADALRVCLDAHSGDSEAKGVASKKKAPPKGSKLKRQSSVSDKKGKKNAKGDIGSARSMATSVDTEPSDASVLDDPLKMTLVELHSPEPVYRPVLTAEYSPDIEEDDTSESTGTAAWIRECAVVSGDVVRPSVFPLSIHGAIAFASYSVSGLPDNMRFKPTLIFQSRSLEYTVSNTGEVALNGSIRLLNVDGNVPASGASFGYSVDPSVLSLSAGESKNITVAFSPTVVDPLHGAALEMKFGNVEDPALRRVVTPLSGSSQCPLVHFDLQQSNYISSGRRGDVMRTVSSEMRPNCIAGAVDPTVRVLEMESRGVLIRNTRKFYIVNPSAMDYDYQWERLDGSSSFVCTHGSGGRLVSDSRVECVWEFTPRVCGLHESMWKFSIPKHHVEVVFLIVGHVLDPEVSFDPSRVHFHSVLLGSKQVQNIKICNNEDLPFAFQFDTTSFGYPDSEAGGASRHGRKKALPVMSVTPLQGTIGAKSSETICLEFCPSAEEMYNYNIKCMVKKKAEPLTLNVKGEGYSVHDVVRLEPSEGGSLERDWVLLNPDSFVNVVDFGRVLVNDRSSQRVHISNRGQYPYDFEWTVPSSHGNDSCPISITPIVGSVAPGATESVTVSFHPKRECRLEAWKSMLSIANGRTNYVVHMKGQGSKPSLDFSFSSYSFGAQYLITPTTPSHVVPQTVLEVANNDSQDVHFDIQYNPKPYLEVDAAATVLRPGESRQIPIKFRPREAGVYREEILFDVNGLHTVPVIVEGEGIPVRLELTRPSMNLLQFGAVKIDSKVQRTVTVVNRSKAPITVGVSKKSIDALSAVGLSISPTDDVQIAPRKVASFEISFQPDRRLPEFTEEVVLDVHGGGHPWTMCQVTGACIGVDVKLDTRFLSFGAVVKGSSLTKRVKILNEGDIGLRFKWPASQLQKQSFVVSPADGFVPAHSDASVDFTFCPPVSTDDGENSEVQIPNVECSFEGAPVLSLAMSGMAVDHPAVLSSIEFRSKVRETVTKSVQLKNHDKENPWVLKPVVQTAAASPYWTCSREVNVPAGGTIDYEIKYSPLTMTSDGNQHAGTLFVALPTGQALVYELKGESLAPSPAGTVSATVVAKQAHVESLMVANWLREVQSFSVQIEFPTIDGQTVIVSGQERIDVPPMSKRSFKLQIMSLTESQHSGKVTFCNEKTGEFVFYNVSFKVQPPQVLKVIPLQSLVRQAVTASISIDNPLQKKVAFTVKCDSAEVHALYKSSGLAVGASGNIEPQSSCPLIISYRPLREVAKTDVSFKIVSPDLGTFPYTLSLSAKDCGPEKALHLSLPLGLEHTHKLRFLHYGVQPCEYKCSLDDEARSPFVVKTPVAKALGCTDGKGIPVTVEVTYDPCSLGEAHDVLVVTSPVGGTYKFPLVGVCTEPQPLGPVDVSISKGANITFRNVFKQAVAFNTVVDNPSFQVKPVGQVPAKKAVTVSVTYKPEGEGRKSGRLTLMSADGPRWVYYLRAVE